MGVTLLEVAQPDVTQTTIEMLQSDWAATIVAAKTNPDIGLKPYLPSGTVRLRPTSSHATIASCFNRSFLTLVANEKLAL